MSLLRFAARPSRHSAARSAWHGQGAGPGRAAGDAAGPFSLARAELLGGLVLLY